MVRMLLNPKVFFITSAETGLNPPDIFSAGPEDVSLFASKDVTHDDSLVSAFCTFQPARDHPGPVEWLSLRASTTPGQFTDADH